MLNSTSNSLFLLINFYLETLNFFSVADENGFIKFFTTYPKLKPIKGILIFVLNKIISIGH